MFKNEKFSSHRMLPPAARCSVCGESDHHSSHCKTLSEPLKEGFYKPSGGYQGGGEDEDEKAKQRIKEGSKLKDIHDKAPL